VISKNLGEGRFGTVHQVIHKETGAIFALKKVPKEKIKSLCMLDQFILEIKLQSFIHHQYILTLYGYFDDADSIYLILEYMEQGTLYAELKRKKTLTEKAVAEGIKQIASAIKYLHENEIAHRDIKP
jgi:serine/threonine protein kinase